MADPSLPQPHHLELQNTWLQGARTRLLRYVDIYHRRRVLDLGSGRGHAAADLVRRCRGRIFALDRSEKALHEEYHHDGIVRIAGNSAQIPLQAQTFDLVFTQNSLMWMKPIDSVCSEICRIIEPGGWLVAIEPDYGGYIEFPTSVEVKDIWISTLNRAGAEPLIGRVLPGLLESLGFDVRVFLFDRLEIAGTERIELLYDLPLTKRELTKLRKVSSSIESKRGWQQLAHLPYFLIAARKLP